MGDFGEGNWNVGHLKSFDEGGDGGWLNKKDLCLLISEWEVEKEDFGEVKDEWSKKEDESCTSRNTFLFLANFDVRELLSLWAKVSLELLLFLALL